MIGGIHRTGRLCRSAVVTVDFILLRQLIEITADGLRTDLKVLDQLFCADIALFTD